jgi:hypothetical protein
VTASQVKGSLGPTSLAEKERLAGGFADWHNLLYRTVWITGTVNRAAVRDAWRRVCLRHDCLRRTYVSADEARTHDDALSEVEFFTAESDDEAIGLMRDFLGRPFPLDGPAFTRIALVQRDEQRYLFGIALDHIITDLISWRRIRDDFRELYDCALAGDPGGIAGAGSYQDFASEQRRLFAGAWGDERREFWRDYTGTFGTYPPPFLADAAPTGEYRPAAITRPLPADAQSRVRALSRQARVTPFSVVTAGVLAGVRKVAGDPVAGISVTNHGRGLSGTAQTAGLFAQTVPLHLDQATTKPVDMVREVFARTLDVFEFGLPLSVAGQSWNEKLTSPDRTAAGLYVELHEVPMSAFFTPVFNGTGAEYVDVQLPGEKLWAETVVLTWNLFEKDPHLLAEYNANCFPAAAVEELLETAESFVLSAAR